MGKRATMHGRDLYNVACSTMTGSPYPKSRRAAVLSDFGEAHNFLVREVPTPALRSDEMLVRVKATSVNPIEWKMRRGIGLPKPMWRLLLADLSDIGQRFPEGFGCSGQAAYRPKQSNF
jgi:hypothetical protein